MNIYILLILIATAVATSSLGVYLVLRKMSMLIDSISHTVLLGIVLTFILVKDLSSPFLIIGAAVMGLITVILTEALVKTKKTSEDSATGLIFPLLFSIAIIMISTSFNGVHLDIDAVLLGKIEFAPFDKLYLNGVFIGPKLLYIMAVVMTINIVFIKILFKELKIISFDTALAMTLGFLPYMIHYLLMLLISLTAVAAFNAVGAVLVVALMIGPAASAIIITKELKYTLFISVFIGVLNGVLGYFLAIIIDVNISGMIASITLLTFILILIFDPRRGLITSLIKRTKLKSEFDFVILIFHLNNHEFNEKEVHEGNIGEELQWRCSKLTKQMKKGLKQGYINISDHIVYLTRLGKEYCERKISELLNG